MIPVLVLTARDAVDDRVRGLDLGADDYVVKPAEIAEVAARLRALIRRSRGEASPTLELGDLALDQAARTVRHSGDEIAMKPREFDVLHEMAQGRTNAGIEASLHLSASTVEKHVSAIFTKLGLQDSPVHRRVAAVLTFLESGSPAPRAR
jgi:two-component system OmpR family response regulator/two-component system response regulator QseB